MSKILVVGNILKDVYLNIDTRSENFETDSKGVKWLDLSFDASRHHFFRRNSSFGGAAISLEVFQKMGLEAQISGSKMNFLGDEKNLEAADAYRYILVADEQAAYLSPTNRRTTVFTTPTESYDYVYIDRSAELDLRVAQQIISYVELSPLTRLIFYDRNEHNQEVRRLLISKADLIVSDVFIYTPDNKPYILIGENQLQFGNVSEDFTTSRTDLATRLSTNLVAAATVIGGFVLGRTVEQSLRMARNNLERAKLDETLSLSELEKYETEDLANKNSNLEMIAQALLCPGKGILAADESGGSIAKKFASMGIEDTYENRRDYRNLFFTTPDLEKYVSGVILFDETARQFSDDGRNFVDFLTAKRIIPGIKVDQGLEKFENSEETWTKGLDGLSTRLNEYYKMGLRFAKWRAAFNITDETPSEMAIERNAEILAEYALACQNAGIVPIVEPEVVYDGNYSLTKSAEVTGKILDSLFAQLITKNVNLRGCILKVNMILAGKQFAMPSTTLEVGITTAQVLRDHVPADLAGVVFLSGGQTPEQATENLQCVTDCGPFPWPVTFSFARALQDPALYAWRGDNANAEQAKQAFLERLKLNSNALNKK